MSSIWGTIPLVVPEKLAARRCCVWFNVIELIGDSLWRRKSRSSWRGIG